MECGSAFDGALRTGLRRIISGVIALIMGEKKVILSAHGQ